MLQDEEGPFAIFARIQAWAASRPDRVGGINHGFDCFYCLSIWVTLPVALVIAPNLFLFFIYWLAISGGAVFLNMLAIKLEQ